MLIVDVKEYYFIFIPFPHPEKKVLQIKIKTTIKIVKSIHNLMYNLFRRNKIKEITVWGTQFKNRTDSNYIL